MNLTTVPIKGINVYNFSSTDELIDHVVNHPAILVAINAEKVVNAKQELVDIVNDNIGYCDGAGAVKALQFKGHPEAVRIPGCELWLKIIDKLHSSKSFYFIGAKPGVVEEVVGKIREKYPDIEIAGFRNGFIADDAERESIINDIALKKPGVVFVAMGSPKQEILMADMKRRWPGAIYQGLGGSFDVFTGHQQRAPEWWRRHDLEFLYRFYATPKRIPRLKSYLLYALKLYTGQL